MHKGVFKGNNLSGDRNILILGESHHHSESNDQSYTTEKVVKNYLSNPKNPSYRFFDKIAACFGFSANERDLFWNKVWFGNYIDESDCGIATNRAKELVIKNRHIYNKKLFEFVNQNSIDTIFCFSRLVYNNLPDRAPFENKEAKCYVANVGRKRDYISKFIYKPGTRFTDDVELEKELVVYCFRHPSAQCGFSPKNYIEYLNKEIIL